MRSASSIDSLEWENISIHWNSNHNCKPSFLILPNYLNLLWTFGCIGFWGTSRVGDQSLVSIDQELNGNTVLWDWMDKAEESIGEDICDSIWDLFSSTNRASEWPVHFFLEEFSYKGFSTMEMIPDIALVDHANNWDLKELGSPYTDDPNHNTTNWHEIKADGRCPKWC